MNKIFCAFMAALFLISCKDSNKSFEAGYENAQNKAAIQQDKDSAAVKLFAFDGGTVVANNKNIFAQGGDTYKGDTILLADAFYVIEHPKGILIWDTGLPENLVGQEPYTMPDGAFTISRKDSIMKQLAQIGLVPSDVDFIGLSHVHFDHTGAAENFTEALWLVQQSTLDFMKSDSIKDNDFYDLKSFDELKNQKIIPNIDYDVFGDGRVVIKYLPGHTAGHAGLFVDLADSGPIMLTGDTYHFQQNRKDGVVPQINYSIPKSVVSIKTFEDFVKEKGAKIYIQHDPADFDALIKAPQPIK